MTERNMAPNGENLNGIVGSDGPLTMSSREIAELTGSSHDNVLKTVRRLVSEGVVFGNETPYTHPQNGQTYSEFRLDYRNTMVVVSGYSPELRARIIDRWMELERRERAASAIDVRDPRQLTKIAIQLIEVNQEQAARIAELEPKAEALDRIATADGSMCLTDAAKHLQVRPKDLIAYLSQHGWIYRRPGGGHWIGYQARVSSGDLEHKVSTVLHANGEERVHEQVRVTAKGMAKLAKLLKPAVQAA